MEGYGLMYLKVLT